MEGYGYRASVDAVEAAKKLKGGPRVADKARVAIEDLLFKHALPSVTTGGAYTNAPVNKGAILGSFALKCYPTAGYSRGHRRRSWSLVRGRGRGRRRRSRRSLVKVSV